MEWVVGLLEGKGSDIVVMFYMLGIIGWFKGVMLFFDNFVVLV